MSTTERKHAKYSPSKLSSFEICAFFKPEKGKSNPAAEGGIRCHDAFESGNHEKLHSEEESALTDYATAYVEHVLGDMKNWELQREIKLETHEKNTWGYGDLLAIHESGGYGHYFDPKFGYHKQGDAETNPQGQAYVLGAFLKYPKLDEIRVHFIYPRWHSISTHTFTRDDIQRIKLRISVINRRAEEAEKFLKAKATGKPIEDPGTRFHNMENCLYCDRKGACDAVYEVGIRIPRKNGYDLPSVVEPENLKTPEDMGRALALASFFEAWAPQVRLWVSSNAKELNIVPEGYQWRSRKSRGKVVNVHGMIAAARGAGLPDPLIEDAMTLSAPKLRDAVSRMAPKGMKAKEAEAFMGKVIAAGFYEEGKEIEFLAKVANKASGMLETAYPTDYPEEEDE